MQSLFGVEDMAGDVVRAGAFGQSLSRGGAVGMLLSHVGGRSAGRWTTTREGVRGLFVRGFVSGWTAAGRTALQMIGDGTLVGLSIAFVARDSSSRVVREREVKRIDLREISLVTAPLLPRVRFGVPGGRSQLARGGRFDLR